MPTYKSPAQEELAGQLEEIRARWGELTPAAILADVKSVGKTHPLYTRFQWDNKVAGEAYRLTQAHRLIQLVRVVYQSRTDEERQARAYVAISRPNSHQPDYEPIESVALDPLKRRLLLQDATRRWQQLKSQFGHLSEFMDMVAEDLRNGKAS
jgi:hypothetical protein